MSTKTGGLQSLLILTIAFTTGSILMGHSSHLQAASPNQAAEKQATPITIGGQSVVTLDRPAPAHPTKPQFIQATILPGNGMNLLQLQAFLPGKGIIDVLTTMPLPDAQKYLETDNDSFGNNSFKLGGAILVPYPNRIRGTLSQDGMTLHTTIDGQQVTLPANWKGKNPGAEVHAMHGLILSSDFQDVKHQNGPKESTVSAVLHAGNFGGHWLSDADVYVQMTLKTDAIDIVVTTKNVGKEALPMAIGFHPYFAFPSGDRTQARIHVPAEKRALVDNYDNVFPTGQIESVKGTPYDFTADAGKPLGSMFLDDCFTDLQRDAEGRVVVNVTDPAANYGIHIMGLSPDIKAIQVYAPPDKDFVAVEPQFNLADPYNKKVWGSTDTGVVTVERGKSVSWHVRLELFTPGK